MAASGHRCGAVEGGGRHSSEARRSRVLEERRGLWGLVNAARTSCGWARSDRRSVESPGAGAVRRSRVGRVEEQTSTSWEEDLLWKQPMLELVALDRHSLSQCPDEEPVTLSQGAAEAR